MRQRRRGRLLHAQEGRTHDQVGRGGKGRADALRLVVAVWRKRDRDGIGGDGASIGGALGVADERTVKVGMRGYLFIVNKKSPP
jgi:hypothetical protein